MICESLHFAVCGGILTEPGNFTSPDFGNGNYSNNLNCEWLIQNPHHTNSSIVVIIDELHLEHHQTCEWDYLEFRLGKSFFSKCPTRDTKHFLMYHLTLSPALMRYLVN